MDIRILIADDHQIFRQGLKALLEKEPDLQVVAEAENGLNTLRLARELIPQVIIMDVNMPDLNGIEATRQILAELPEAIIIGLSMHSDHRFVMGMFQAGVHSYLLKECAFEELVQTIRQALGARPAPGRSRGQVMTNGRPPFAKDPCMMPLAELSGREVLVLQLMAEGKSNHQIADLLHISVKTVESHRQQITHKVGTRSVAALTKYALRQGITSLEP
jgi:DNA-binding NarL/FixJ family response regulator